MMISPEVFYETELKGKTAPQIMNTIQALKQEIELLKAAMERPGYAPTMSPSEDVRLACTREYLDRARRAYAEVGGVYTPFGDEVRAAEFNANIPYISKVEFSIGGFFDGYEIRTYTVEGNEAQMEIEHSVLSKSTNNGGVRAGRANKAYLCAALADLHVGEWRKHYTARHFGVNILDGTQWTLKIYFTSGYGPVEISGDNAYPYNFGSLLKLFQIS